jgi:tetratricopeptide (TPR) repeat protein
MDNEKQCINLLKNMGSCYFKLGKVEESLGCFREALEFSERRLEGDQKVKVEIYSEMAIVYNRIQETKPAALECAQKALQMGKRLQMTWFTRPKMEDIVKGSVETVMRKKENAS